MSGENTLKLALKARAARSQAQAALSADPIAIIGLGCRLPGSVRTPEDFWSVLSDGRDVVTRIPAERWDGDALYDADLSAPGKSITREAGFLDRIEEFDADYFGILPREAEQMDPQQRLFLEVAVEALDDAGQPHDRLARTRTGVYVASYHNDYAGLIYDDRDAIDLRSLTGTLHSVLANRLSWFLDLRGPSMSIDTACSSSLVAIHLACQSLRFGETDLALAGGVSIMITPDLMISMSKVGFMSPDGRCKTFDASANGFGRGEGCGVVVLKRLSDAIVDQDRVLAVIRGSVVNQDGRSTVMAAPSGPAQEALIREALATSQVDAGRIGFVEAHGTGTALGDPIEVEALAAAIGRVAGDAPPCRLGSAKANIGHLEAAAGVTGLIKTVLALRHEAIPPQPHYTSINPHIDLEGTRLSIPTTLVPWPAGPVPRAAAVSSFGVGGTNAHVIVEEAPSIAKDAATAADGDRARLLPISAKTPAALRELCDAWAGFLASGIAPLADICRTAGERRTHYPVRKAIVAASRQEFARALYEARDGTPAPTTSGAPRVAFVFCGQGPQWHAMGRQLLAREATFRATVERVDEILGPLSGFSLVEELGRSESETRLASTMVAQPALFALQVGLCAQLAHWGIKPAAVLGHSIGELAALHVAGVLDLEEATRIVWHRARLMQQATGQGRMASVAMTAAAALDLVRQHPGVDVAAMNAPSSVVLAGTPAALESCLNEIGGRGVAHRMLPVDYAFHSAQMEPISAAFVRELGQVRAQPPAARFYSSVLGGRLDAGTVDARYFGRNVREPVRFAAAASTLLADGCDLIVEIGPHPVLGAALDEIAAAAGASPRIVPAMRRTGDERIAVLGAVAAAYEAGLEPDWAAIADEEGSVTSLPPYPWQRARYWVSQRRSPQPAVAGPLLHPVLGRELPLAGGSMRVFEGSSQHAGNWLADHKVFGDTVLPAAAVMEALSKAAALVDGADAPGLADFTMDRPVVIRDGESVRWQVVVEVAGGAATALAFHVAEADAPNEWTKVASASAAGPARPSAMPIAAELVAGAKAAADAYARFERHGVEFGPRFRLLDEIRVGSGWAKAGIAVPRSGDEGHLLPPAMLDAGLQLCTVAASAWDAVYLPVGARRVELAPWSGEPLVAVAKAALRGNVLSGDISFETADGTSVARIEGMSFARADAARGFGGRCETYVEGWRDEAPAAVACAKQGAWLVYDDDAATCSRALASVVGEADCWIVRPGTAWQQCGERAFAIDPASPGDARRLLELRPWGEAPLRGIVHGWSLDAEPTAGDLDRQDTLALASLLHLVQAARSNPAPIRVVTSGGAPLSAAGAAGLAHVAAIEEPELHVRVIDLAPEGVDPDRLGRELVADAPGRVALRSSRRLVPRLRRIAVNKASAAAAKRLVVARPGDFSGLDLVPLQSRKPGTDEVRIKVLTAGVNFRDVLTTLDLYPGSPPPLGVECVGEVVDRGADVRTLSVGDRVFGYVPGSFASEATVPAAFLSLVPGALDDDQAATLPVAFGTALHGLERLAGLERGEHVLIHAAAGGVGMAAVQLALDRGAIVHATVGSAEKRDRLRSLGVTNLYNSRSLDFADEILAATGGRGVAVVLNSLAGPFADASFRCLAPAGRFLEIGKRDIWSPQRAAAERPDAAYHVYDLGSEAERNPPLFAGLMRDLCKRLAEGRLRPLPVLSFPLAAAADAMRTMALARHVGKLAVRVAEQQRPFQASPQASYLITGGLGALGLETAAWLLAAGARHLVLCGRSQPSAQASRRIADWRDAGLDIRVEACDVADAAAVEDLLARIRASMPPLKGIVHAAGVVRDGTLANQSWSEARIVLEGKAHGARHLDRLTRDLHLEFFILYSAAAVVLGGAGQSLYPAANAQLDALARERAANGLPALSVAWGLWSGIGMAADSAGDVWAARGLRSLTPAKAFMRLEQLLSARISHAAILDIGWSRFIKVAPVGLDRSYFSEVAPGSQSDSGPHAAAVSASPLQAIRQAPAGERRDGLVAFVSEKVAQILGRRDMTLDETRPLKEYGIDSLMSVELRNLLARAGGTSLPATLLFDYPTLEALAGFLLRAWSLIDATASSRACEAEQAAPAPPADAKAELDALTEHEIEELLRKELNLAGGVL